MIFIFRHLYRFIIIYCDCFKHKWKNNEAPSYVVSVCALLETFSLFFSWKITINVYIIYLKRMWHIGNKSSNGISSDKICLDTLSALIHGFCTNHASIHPSIHFFLSLSHSLSKIKSHFLVIFFSFIMSRFVWLLHYMSAHRQRNNTVRYTYTTIKHILKTKRKRTNWNKTKILFHFYLFCFSFLFFTHLHMNIIFKCYKEEWALSTKKLIWHYTV